MDSGNSGSFQSSSGGDEEYDSRTESISAFFNSTTAGGPSSLHNLAPPPQPPPFAGHYQPPNPFFDTLSYLDSNPNPLLNLDIPWSRTFRPSQQSNPNSTDITGLIASSSSTAPLARGGLNINPPPPVQQSAPPTDQPTTTTAPRSSKKRSRASRRAPTTVLTTDTTNFRAMVQEFTGIPAPPFASSSSSFPRPRFDLFHPSTLRSSAIADTHAPTYILRPFAQKFQAPPFHSISSTTITTTPTLTNPTSNSNANPNPNPNPNPNANANANIAAPSSNPNPNTTTNNYQTLLNIQNPVHTFQSFLQSPLAPKYSLPTTSLAPVIPSEGNYGHLGLPTLVTSEGMQSRPRGQGEELSGWADGPRRADDEGDQGPLRPPVVGNCKLNYSASGSSDFHAEKGNDGVPARGEGIVDSWICSSD